MKLSTSMGTILVKSTAIDLNKVFETSELPKEQLMEISGPKLSGKIRIVLRTTVDVQKQGRLVTFIDTEHSVGIRYLKKLSIHCIELLLAQPDTDTRTI